MSKLSFRAKALDASKPMPIYMAEELPDLPDYSAINRAVPQMPSGMEKEEECEHHLQRAICAGLIIPTPEVSDIPQKEYYDKVYPANYKQPRQLVHMQPFTMEQDIPDYDMDSEDEVWLQSQAQRLDLKPLKFEEMMDRLEKSSGQTVVTLNEAKALLKEDDDLIIAVFDYWLNKRLKMQHPLILSVKTEHRVGTAANNPYIAFRRRTEKMQTRKNRKNDEVSYEKMLKLKRDFYRAVTLLEMVKKREKAKREHVHLTIEIFEKRFHAKDFSGSVVADASIKSSRPAFTPIFQNHYTNQSWPSKPILKDEGIPRKEKRQYKKRKHKSLAHRAGIIGASLDIGSLSSDEEPSMAHLSPEREPSPEDDGPYSFRRNKLCSYHMPLPYEGNFPWCSREENGSADVRYRYTLTSLSNPKRCVGFARRRMGRGGRIILDRATTGWDNYWRNLDYTIFERKEPAATAREEEDEEEAEEDTEVPSISSNSVDPDVLTDSVTNAADSQSIQSDTKVFNHLLRTDIKSEIPSDSESNRTTSECFGDAVIKAEEDDLVSGVVPLQMQPYSKEQEEQILEYLQTVSKDWLHFRPKTPPPDYEPPCNLLPEEASYFNLDGTPFSMEIRTLKESKSLVNTSTFVTEPFAFDNLDSLDIPITDTRQPSDTTNHTPMGLNLNVNVGLDTLNSSVNNDSVHSTNWEKNVTTSLNLFENFEDTNDDRIATFGNSRFFVSDLCTNPSTTPSSNASTTTTHTSKANEDDSSRTFPSPKINNSTTTNAAVLEECIRSTSGAISNTNGILPQFGYEVSMSGMKNNKLSCALNSETDYPNATSNTLSLHTSAHTLTLNSHSANIFEIPLTDDPDADSASLVNSHGGAESGVNQTNNKTKSIVRKNNLVMEVT